MSWRGRNQWSKEKQADRKAHTILGEAEKPPRVIIYGSPQGPAVNSSERIAETRLES